ncbi:MAG: phasin family protein [Alphaproteobacteria bacterium]
MKTERDMKTERKEIPVDAPEVVRTLRKAEPVQNGDMMVALIRAGQSYNEGLFLLGQELLDFSRERLSKNSATALSLAHCKDWNEASQIQRDWVRAAAEEYSAEMGKLLRLAARTTVDSCRPLQEQAPSMWPESNGRVST